MLPTLSHEFINHSVVLVVHDVSWREFVYRLCIAGSVQRGCVSHVWLGFRFFVFFFSLVIRGLY